MNAAVATTISAIITTIMTAATSGIPNEIAKGFEVGVGVAVGVGVGWSVSEVVGVGVGVAITVFTLGACGLGAVKNGTKLTVPKLKLSLKS